MIVCYGQDILAARETAKQLHRAVCETAFPTVGKVTCSIGVTELKEGDTLETSFERMDKALYQAKSDGRNCVRTL